MYVAYLDCCFVKIIAEQKEPRETKWKKICVWIICWQIKKAQMHNYKKKSILCLPMLVPIWHPCDFLSCAKHKTRYFKESLSLNDFGPYCHSLYGQKTNIFKISSFVWFYRRKKFGLERHQGSYWCTIPLIYSQYAKYAYKKYTFVGRYLKSALNGSCNSFFFPAETASRKI